MAHRKHAQRIMVALLGVVWGFTTLDAAPKVQSILNERSAELIFASESPYSELESRLDDIVMANLNALPFIRRASRFYTRSVKQADATKKVEEWFLLVSAVDRNLMADSIFKLTKDQTQCGAQMGCRPGVTYTLEGPVQSESHVVTGLDSRWIEKSFSLTLSVMGGSGGFMPPAPVTMTAPGRDGVEVMTSVAPPSVVPSKDGAVVRYSFNIVNMAYQKYLDRLAHQNLIAGLPTQETILKTVLLQFFSFKKQYSAGRG